MRLSARYFPVFASALLLFSCDYKPKNQGRALYLQHCQSCHMESGQGLGKVMPPLANADFIQNRSSELPCLIRNGLKGPVTVNGDVFNGEMTGFSQMTEVEISNLIFYIQKELNDMDVAPRIDLVREQLEACK